MNPLAKPFLILTMTALIGIYSANSIAGAEAGLAAYETGNFEKALKEFKEGAKNGDPIAQYHLGMLYFNGRGVKKNLKSAANWWRKAAEQNNPESQYALGSMYLYGNGQKKDFDKARDLLSKASAKKETGALMALEELGLMYLEGRGAKQNYERAFELLGRTAENGSAISQYFLGTMYANGFGTNSDNRIALRWFGKSAENEFPWAYALVGLDFYQGEIADVARQNFKKAIEFSKINPTAFGDVASGYVNKAAEEKFKKTFNLYEAAAGQGNKFAQFWLGNVYWFGLGTINKDGSKAREWYAKATTQSEMK